MNYQAHSWIKEFPAAITVCDLQGTILEMNDKAVETFENDGGRALIGKNVLDCHPDPARGKLERLLDKQKTNVYTIEKNGKKKLIYQAPWYTNSKYAGFVELSFEISQDLPHIIHN